MKLDYKKTFLIGFGFLATSVWVIYNNYVPIFLKPLTEGWGLKIGTLDLAPLLLGAIMTIDNIFGVIFQPLVGSLSDRTRTRFGKRMPYILIGIPVCAVLFALVPMMRTSLLPLMLTIIVFNFVMSTWRSPVVALMPDLTPAPLRSKANGVINMMGGIGGLIAFFAGGMIFNSMNRGIVAVDTVKDYNYNGPFLLGSIVMIAAVVALFFFVKEPPLSAIPASQSAEKPKKEKVKLEKGERKSLVLLLFAIFFWFTGYNAIESFFSLFATNVLTMPGSTAHLTGGQSSILLGIFTISLIVAAIPAGIVGGKIGRRKTILIGLIGVTVMFVPMFFVHNVIVIGAMLFVSGAFWAFVNINSLPMVVEMAGGKIGTFTGYYYTFSCSSAIVSPILFGGLMSLTNNNYALMFFYAAVAFVIAIACVSFVKHGESVTQKLSITEVMGMQDD